MTIRHKTAFWCFAVFLLLAGCQKAASPVPTLGLTASKASRESPVPGGESSLEERQVSVGQTTRSYLLYVPAKARTAVSVPVVLVFHGGGSQPELIAGITGFNSKADAEGFVVVYPRGTGSKPTADRFGWNGGLCCGPAQKNNVDDVGFIRTLLDDLARTLPVDEHRIYATGLDVGALMSYRLACELADRIAAIGPVAGTQNMGACLPSQPVSIIDFHGTLDGSIPYAGGVGKGTGNFSYVSVKDSISFWLTADLCPQTVVREDTGPFVHEKYGPCSNGSAVELYTIQDGSHNWPGGASGGTREAPSTREVNATDILWNFFAAHPKPENAS
jgi:polyhydroxybutyrate depolymerase